MLALKGIDYAYGSSQVLFGVDLDMFHGEALALLGTNGAGKSTLLRIVAGLAAPSSGRVRLLDQDVTSDDVVARVRRGVIMVPGGRALFRDLTVRENLQVAAYTLGRNSELIRQRIDHALSLFPKLADRRGQLAGSLSGGEQQQLALAKALLLEPKLLCVDELSLGLAPAVIEMLMRTLQLIQRSGVTLLLVEQSLNIAASLCERCVFMEKGAIQFDGPTSGLIDSSDLARAVFLGRRR